MDCLRVTPNTQLPRALAAVILLTALLASSCAVPAGPAAPALTPGVYEVDYKATLHAIEAERGRPLTEDELDDVSVTVAFDGPFATFNADGTFSWDNRPERHYSRGPGGVAVIAIPMGWVGGSGTYRIRDGDQLVLDYEKVSNTGIADALCGWYGRDITATEYEEMRGDGPPLHVTPLGECPVHEIRGSFIHWRYGRDCERFVVLRRR